MSDFSPIYGTAGLLITCGIIIVGLTISLAVLWLYLAGLSDVLRKTETEFKDRTLWIIVFAASFFMGFMWLSAIVYYFMYRPTLAFWRDPRF
jgi:hypothetical protein